MRNLKTISKSVNKAVAAMQHLSDTLKEDSYFIQESVEWRLRHSIKEAEK